MNGQTNRHTDVLRETMIPHHYLVAEYKKVVVYLFIDK